MKTDTALMQRVLGEGWHEIVHPLWGKTYSYGGVFKATAAPD